MNLRPPRYSLVIAALLLVAGAAILDNLRLTKELRTQRTEHPPTKPVQPTKCAHRGLVAHFKFDEASASGTPDSSPAANFGAFELAPAPLAKLRFGLPQLVDGKVDRGLEFNLNQWVSAGNNDCFASEQISVAAWVWQAQDGITVPTIAAKSAWPYTGWWLCSTSTDIQGHDRYIDFGIGWGSGVAHVESGYQLPLREWHHIVGILDNIAHEAQFFVDGKPRGEKKTGVRPWLVNWDHDLLVGGYDGSGRWGWKGKLDDVRVYNRVLSPDEAAEIYSTPERVID